MDKYLKERADKEYTKYMKRRLRVDLFKKVKVTDDMRDTIMYNWIAVKIAFKDFINYFRGLLKI